jgi:hypothetical protein
VQPCVAILGPLLQQTWPLAQYNVKATGHVAKLRRDLSV